MEMMNDGSGEVESGEPDVYENFEPEPTVYTASKNYLPFPTFNSLLEFIYILGAYVRTFHD